MARISVGRILLDHFKTLRSLNQSYNFMNFGDMFLFLVKRFNCYNFDIRRFSF
jgi:hypothetical protein